MKHIFNKALMCCGIAMVITAGNQAYAQQTTISYDYVEAAVTTGEVIDEDFMGFGVAASFSITESFFMKGSYSVGESDDKYQFGFGAAADEIEVSGFTFGVGYHAPLSTTTDFVTSLNYVNSEVEFANFSDDANGYSADIGLRSMVMSNLELEALLAYTDGSDADGDVSFEANARFYITPAIAVTLGYSDGDDISGVSAGLRLNF